jgi:chemotaxis protein methyltransferase CheR
MKDVDCVRFLQWGLPRLGMRWPGFRKVRKQVCKRIDRRLRELGLEDVAAYEAHLESNPGEWAVLDGFCRITISRFYRDRRAIDSLRDGLIPDLAKLCLERGESELRCWSAGCASGEEPYTLSMIWALSVGARFPGLSIRILATDADERVLERARLASYQPSSLKDLPSAWRTAAFTPTGRRLTLLPAFREAVEFKLQDIRTALPEGSFHLILCRNLVFTYFEERLQRELLERILGLLPAGGALVIGSHEGLPCGGGPGIHVKGAEKPPRV